MPELPEVETVRAGLEPLLRGRRFQRVEQRRKDLRFPLPDRFVERLTGARVLSVDRRAKYLVLPLDSGEVLAMHLGMTGRFTVKPPRSSPSPRSSRGEGHGGAVPPARGEGQRQGVRPYGSPSRRGDVADGGSDPIAPAAPHPSPLPAEGRGEGTRGEFVLGDYTYEHGGDATHDHVVFTMSGGAVVTYNDARRFGYMTLIDTSQLTKHAFFAGLGVEPLSDDLNGDYLAAKARGRKLDLKAFLMDQRIVAGLGNIYVCEALFRARLDPFKGAARLATKTGKPTPHAVRLAAEIKAVLRDAIRAGGSTLRDYKQADGSEGSFQHSFGVYGREGEPCSRKGCRGIVRRKTQGGRSTFYCPVCQR